MTRSYVAIDEPVHRLLRNLTQRTPLNAGMDAEAGWHARYEPKPEQVPDTYYCLALLHGMGGMDSRRALGAQASFSAKHRVQILEQAGYFDATRLDRRCGRDIRLKPARTGPTMVSAELLCFGTGTLRALNDDPRDRLHQAVMEQHGRLSTGRQEVYATIRALHGWANRPDMPTGRDSFESTNVIYGDVLGEVEQLWERRAELLFLDSVAHALCQFFHHPVICAGMQPPLNLAGVVALHLRHQRVWRTPPRTGRALLRRIEFVLGNVTVDSWPKTDLRPAQPGTSSGGSAFGSSGYDGWLTA